MGFGAAARLADIELKSRSEVSAVLRNRLEQSSLPDVSRGALLMAWAPDEFQIPEFRFERVDGDALADLLNVANIYASTGSHQLRYLVLSHVVMAMTGSYARAERGH